MSIMLHKTSDTSVSVTLMDRLISVVKTYCDSGTLYIRKEDSYGARLSRFEADDEVLPLLDITSYGDNIGDLGQPFDDMFHEMCKLHPESYKSIFKVTEDLRLELIRQQDSNEYKYWEPDFLSKL